jgi:heptose I phosphotransferase
MLHLTPAYADLFDANGLTAGSLFTDPRVTVWRSVTERENATLDLATAAGESVRLHVKRFHPAPGRVTPAELEARGITLLERNGVPTPPLVAWAALPDGRSVLVTADLAGYRAADKVIAGPGDFERVLLPTADLAAKLHDAALHHRDLYLCHFFVRPDPLELKLIDAARVRELPPWPLRRRWVVKDLAQFWYSTTQLPITDEQRARWLARYAERRGLRSAGRLARAVRAKAERIGRHDRKLRAALPKRNVSIPGG